jgi:4-hydroxybenzoate polyprenyltransferase
MILLPWIVFSSVVVIYGNPNGFILLLGLVYFISVYGIVTIFNDFADLQIDIENKRNMPLAKGQVTKRQLKYAAIILTLLSISTAALIGLVAIIIFILYILLGWIYSYKPFILKNRGWYGIILLSFCYAVLPWILAASIQGVQQISALYLYIASTFFISVATLPLKDFKDVKGDKKFKKNTVLLKHGSLYVKNVLIIATLAAYAALIAVIYPINLHAAITLIILIVLLATYIYKKIDIDNKIQRNKLGIINRVVLYVILLISMFISSST